MGKSYNNTYKKIQEMAQKKAENEGSEEKKPTEVIVPQSTEKLPVDEEKIIPETEEKKEPVEEKPIEEEKQATEIEVPKTVDDGKQEEPATADEPIAETPIEEKEEDKTEVVPVPHSTLQRVIY